MPKILIKEFDKTSAGTPGSYANYSVLIPGYMSRTPVLTADVEKAKAEGKTGDALPVADKIQPDSNGVYEFSSKQDFIDTIGIVATEQTIDVIDEITKEASERKEVHYGNKMARELLNLGYTVIYVPIKSIMDMLDEDFWSIFTDKASYDFRFICHGLLDADADTMKDYNDFLEAEDAVNNNVAILTRIAKEVDEDSSKVASTLFTNEKDFVKEIPVIGATEVADYDAAVAYYITKADDDKKTTAEKALAERLADINKNVTPSVINTINGNIAKLASYITTESGEVTNAGRGDCVALIELCENIYNTGSRKPEALIIDGIQRMSSEIGTHGAYCAMTVPSVYYKTSAGADKLPGAFHYLACFMNSLTSGFAEWYAAAGYTRGVSSYTIDHTSVKLGEIAINALEPRNIKDQSTQPPFACNVIANFRGSYYLWGNRTAHQLGDANSKDKGDLVAHHFLNIRQLCTTIKKQLYVSCRRFTFDPNSDTLWFNFVNSITPTLEVMKADQGIRDYKIVKVYTDKKATLKAKIRIIPIEAVEDFDIEVSLEDSFGETVVSMN